MPSGIPKNGINKWWFKKGIKRKPLSEETKKKIGLANKGLKRTDDVKKNISERQKGVKKSKEFCEKLRIFKTGKKLSKETCLKISKANKGRVSSRKGVKLSEETKKKIGLANTGRYLKEKGSNWQGGKSFEAYGYDWTNTLRRSIRERDGYICQMKGCNKIQGDETHSIHHIDYDKQNNNPENLITLCRSCHSKTNYNRKYWIEYFNKNI